MTLIMALANKKQVVQISDRRLSSNGKLVDDESNKCGILFCLNARMTFGYTGLARWKSFSTFDWLLKILHDSAPPDYTIGEILERVKHKATYSFKNDPILKNMRAEDKKLSVMFSGYINVDGENKPGCAILSNYHNFENNTAFEVAQDEFIVNYSSAKKEEENPTLVQRVGNWRAMTQKDIDSMRDLLVENKPSEAIVGKGLWLMRDIADRPKSAGTIGKQLTSIVIPKDFSKPIESSYSSDVVKFETYMPAMVYLLPDQHATITNISVIPVEKDTLPLSVPKIRRNAPCPCGSKKKYKFCHGKRN
jgi:hypothetical protein